MTPRNNDNHSEHDEHSNLKDLPKRDLELSDEESAKVSGGCRKAGGDQNDASLPTSKSIIVVC